MAYFSHNFSVSPLIFKTKQSYIPKEVQESGRTLGNEELRTCNLFSPSFFLQAFLMRK